MSKRVLRSKVLLILILLPILMPNMLALGLLEFTDDYENEDYVQSKYDVVRNTTYNCMEIYFIPPIEGSFSGWHYRKTHNIVGSTDGAQTDYQVSITAYYTSGVDSDSEVYLDSKCQIDFDDIRFTEDDGVTELAYWLETKTDSVSAVFWIKLNSVPANPDEVTIYIYYGNNAVSTTSDGFDTFPILYDDFEDGTVGVMPDGWSMPSGSAGDYMRVSNSVVYQGTKSAIVHEDAVSPDGHFLKTPALCDNVVLHVWFRAVTAARRAYAPSLLNGINFLYRDSDSDWRCVVSAAWTTIPNWGNPSQGVWYRLELYYDESTDKILYIRDRTANSGWLAGPGTWGVDGLAGLVTAGVYTSATDFYIDVAYIRMYANPEPTHGEWGSEEESAVYAEEGYFYTKNLLDEVSGDSVVLLTNCTLEVGSITVQFSEDNITWVDSKGSETEADSQDLTGYGVDICTGGSVLASSEYPPSGYEATKAFDDNDAGTRWSSNNVAKPHWLRYDLGSGIYKRARKLRMKPYGAAPNCQIKDFVLQGSNTSVLWVDILSATAANSETWQEWTFDNNGYYRYYRIYVITAYYTGGNQVSIWEAEIMEGTYGTMMSSDELVEGFESIDLRDLNYSEMYLLFNYTRGSVDTTPRLFQIRVITNGLAEGGVVNVPRVEIVALNNTAVNCTISVFLFAADVEGLAGYIFENNATGVPTNSSYTGLSGIEDTALEDLASPVTPTRVCVAFYVEDTDGYWGVATDFVFVTATGAEIEGGGGGTGGGLMLFGILGAMGLVMFIIWRR